MRVTTKAYTQNFLNSSNTLLSKLLKSEQKILSQRKYNRASEDSASAAKAAHVRKSLANLAIYDENAKTAKDFFYAAEDALYDISGKIYMNVKQKVVSIQDTKDQTQFNIVAQEITQLADQIVQDMNSDFAGRQMFGSASNDTTPFTVHSSVRVFDKDGVEILLNKNESFGNEIDRAAVQSNNNPESQPALNVMFMNDREFYTKGGEKAGTVITPEIINNLKIKPEEVTDKVYKGGVLSSATAVFRDGSGKAYEAEIKDGEAIFHLYDGSGQTYPASFKLGASENTDGTITLTGTPELKDTFGNEVNAVRKGTNMYAMEVREAHNRFGEAVNLNDIQNDLDALEKSALADMELSAVPKGAKVNDDGSFTVEVSLYDEDGIALPDKVAVTYVKDGEGYKADSAEVKPDKDSVVSDDGSAIIFRSKDVKIDDPGNYEGSAYYIKDGVYGKDGMAIDFKINGEFDRSGATLDRVVCFNDIPISLKGDDLLRAVNGGTIVYYDGSGNVEGCKTVDTGIGLDALADVNAFPGSDPIYVDVGLGINYSKLDSTALNVCLNGAKISGWGTDDDGDSLNLMQLIYDCAKAMRAGDKETVNRHIDKLEAANDKISQAITDLGVKQNDMDFYTEKNSVYRLSLLAKQNEIEGVDLEEEITNWKTVDAAYNAALSMGAQILPKSLFDFI